LSPRYVHAYQTIHGQSKHDGRAMNVHFASRYGFVQSANRCIASFGATPSRFARVPHGSRAR
jgi:hypothetical protein